MEKGTPAFTYVLIAICCVGFLASAIGSLVTMVRKTGFDQYYWAFQAVVSVIALSIVITTFASRD